MNRIQRAFAINEKEGSYWRFKIWLMAIRPKSLTTVVAPVFVGSCAGAEAIQHFDWLISLFAFISALWITIGTNLINDALDFKKGADTEERIGFTRVTQSGLVPAKIVLIVGLMCLGCALLFGIPLIIKGGWPLVVLLTISLWCAYAYTGGPYPVAYHGWGEVFVMLFYGLAATGAVFYLQSGTYAVMTFIAGMQLGCHSTALIAINNLRDHVQDAKANKRTLAVRWGVTASKIEIALLVVFPYLLGSYWLQTTYWLAAILPLLAMPLGLYVVFSIAKQQPSAFYNSIFGKAALHHLLFALLLGISFLLKIP